MHDELTEIDIRKMQEELDYRLKDLRPKLIEQVQIARDFGDLSENFEYKAAKQEKNRNDSRIRYLQNMIKTAVIIPSTAATDNVSLFDTLEVYFEEEKETRSITIVTTLRQNPLKGLISKESPLGKALMGKSVGDRVKVIVSDTVSYFVEIRSVTKGHDDESLEILSY